VATNERAGARRQAIALAPRTLFGATNLAINEHTTVIAIGSGAAAGRDGHMDKARMASHGLGLGRRSLVLAAAGAAGTLAAPRVGRAADSKTVYLLTWGGTIQQMLERDGWSKKFADATGYNVVLVPKATGTEIMATAIAQKAKPQVDVVQSDLLPWLAGIGQELFVPIDAAGVPNMVDLLAPALIKEQTGARVFGVEPYGDLFCLIYNKETFAKKGWAPPTQWTDLERPELKGQLLIPPGTSAYGLYVLIILARAHGGGENNIEPGFAAMKKIAPGVVDWSNTFAKMSQFLEDGTAALAFHGIAGAFDMQKRGLPVGFVVPTPAYMSPTAIGIMKGGPNPDGARAFVNWWISPEVLGHRAETYGQTVTNKKVKLSDEAAAKLPNQEQLSTMTEIDYFAVLRNRDAWVDRFQREVSN
jgi:putative spermidine/putrescine transport system substrate-binding protein